MKDSKTSTLASALAISTIMAAKVDKQEAETRFQNLKVGDIIKSFKNTRWQHVVTEKTEFGFKTRHSNGTDHSYGKDALRIWGSSVYIDRPAKGKKPRKSLEVEV